MSVLIKGMEMPISCYKCPFLDYEEGFCFASGVKHKSGWYELILRPGEIKDGRHEDCPIVLVPPHGRLIDADAIDWVEGRDEQDRPVYLLLKMQIDDIPTIIEAEPYKEKGE